MEGSYGQGTLPMIGLGGNYDDSTSHSWYVTVFNVITSSLFQHCQGRWEIKSWHTVGHVSTNKRESVPGGMSDKEDKTDSGSNASARISLAEGGKGRDGKYHVVAYRAYIRAFRIEKVAVISPWMYYIDGVLY